MLFVLDNVYATDKYIIYEDENNEEFYDIKNDALEENNLISSEPYLDKIEVFREIYAKEDQQILKFHCDTIFTNLSRKI